jgi:hypothetical protein
MRGRPGLAARKPRACSDGAAGGIFRPGCPSYQIEVKL